MANASPGVSVLCQHTIYMYMITRMKGFRLGYFRLTQNQQSINNEKERLFIYQNYAAFNANWQYLHLW